MKFLYLKGMDIFGPFEAEQIVKEEIFSEDLLVCPEDKAEQEAAWKPASRYEDFKVLLGKGNPPVKEGIQEKPKEEPKLIIESSAPFTPETQDKNTSQDLPPLEDTETETDVTETEEFSFQQIMNDMADKHDDNQDEGEDIKDHTFHIANKEDNLLEDLPAHSLLGPEEDADSAPKADKSDQKNIAPKQNDEIDDKAIQQIGGVQRDRDFLEISNNRIISSSDGRVKKQRPNDLLFILSFLVLMVVAIALCMAFWNMMNGGNNIPQKENVQKESVVQPNKAEQDSSLIPEVSEQQPEEQEVNKEIFKAEPATAEEQVIDIVKNTRLKNKGSIGDYLDRVYGKDYKSSWSAKPFTDNIYIVEFFASQVRSEPYVYLFRVDLDQKKITGALNNITLDLLA